MTWMVVLQLVLVMIVLTFCVLITLSFIQSGKHQQSTDRLAELNAERALEDAKLHLLTLQMNDKKGPDDGKP